MNMFDGFKKRNDIVVDFDSGKISQAITKALTDVYGEQHSGVPANVLNEVHTRLQNIHFETSPKIPDINQVQTSIIDALENTGLHEVAIRYRQYKEARDRARKRICVQDKPKGVNITDDSLLLVNDSGYVTSTWDRQRIVDALRKNTSLEDKEILASAKIAENRIIDSGIQIVTTSFIREMVNNVLLERGHKEHIQDLSVYRVSSDFIYGLMAQKSVENSNIVSNNPEAVSQNIAGLVLKEWSLDNVFSAKVSSAHRSAAIHIHDLDFPQKCYCSAHSIVYIAKYGLVGLSNLTTESAPAKTASVLTGHLNTFLASIQANYAGALGLGYVNIFYAPYVEGMSKKQMFQVAQELIFNGSQNAFSRSGQTLFLDFNIHTNVPEFLKDVPAIGPGGKYYAKDVHGDTYSLRERGPAEGGVDTVRELIYTDPHTNRDIVVHRVCRNEHGLFNDKSVQNGSNGLKALCYGDYAVSAQSFGNALLDVWKKGDKNGRIFSFPKCDFHVDSATFEDPGALEMYNNALQVAAENGSPYFVFDRDTVSLSACCFDGSQEVLIKGSNKVTKVKFQDFDNLTYADYKRNLTIFHNGSWCKGKYIEVDSTENDFFKVTTSNKKEMTVTDNHLLPTLSGLKEAKELTTDDYLEFNQLELDGITNHDLKLTFEQGFLIGLYLGDGSIYTGNENKDKYEINLSLNKEKYAYALPYLTTALRDCGIEANISLNTPVHNCYPVRISSQALIDFIKTWTSGSYSYEKGLNLNALLQSPAFRKGILEGLYASDGGNSNRIYSTSKELIDGMECLITSLGLQSTIDISDRTDEPVVIRGETYTRNYPLYCIRWFNLKNRRVYPNHYVVKNNSVYFKIASIENLGKISDKAYCFQMLNEEEPYFTLPSGVITHNCRLRTTLDDKSMLFFPEKLSFCGFQNITINIPQAAIRVSRDPRHDSTQSGPLTGDSQVWRDFISKIDEMMDLAMQAHLDKKAFTNTIMHSPGQPLYQIGKKAAHGEPYVDLEKATYIIGLIGVDNAMFHLTGKHLHEDNDVRLLAMKLITHMYLKAKKLGEEHGLKVTLEESPAESAARRLAKTDMKLFPEAHNIVNGCGTDAEYYTNSIHFVADADIPLITRIREQSKFHSLIQSGAIVHAFVGESRPSAEAIGRIVKKTFEDTQCAQLTISPEVTFCNVCGESAKGLVKKCWKCGSEDVDGITRVVGYFSIVKNWNKSKREGELLDRQRGTYTI